MKILIAGDLSPTSNNLSLFEKGDLLSLMGEELLCIWNSAEKRIFNLEVPLVNVEKPIDKCGPNLIAPTYTINGISALNPSLVTLANNHIMDQGVQGLNSTIEILDNINIPFTGVGNNLSESCKPFFINANDTNIGVYNCAENEFSIATEKTPGANPYDPLTSFDHVKDLKSQCNYVIVIYHGGKEYYRYPSPQLQRISRKFVDCGADVVICQHSHCIGALEKYNNSTIVYGQGNFIFNKKVNELWSTSIILDIEINDKLIIDYIPIVTTTNGIRLANVLESEEILNDFYNRSKEILNFEFVDKNYKNFSEDYIGFYLSGFAGYSKLMSRIDRYIFRGRLLKYKFSKDKLIALQNFIECEAHRELLLKGLETWISEKL